MVDTASNEHLMDCWARHILDFYKTRADRQRSLHRIEKKHPGESGRRLTDDLKARMVRIHKERMAK